MSDAKICWTVARIVCGRSNPSAMNRIVFLLAGLALFIYLFVHLGPAAVFEMLGRIGWSALPIAAAYAAFQSLRVSGADGIRLERAHASLSRRDCGSGSPAKRSSSSPSPGRSSPNPRRLFCSNVTA